MQDVGKLVLRLTVGVLLLLHGLHKIIHGIHPIVAMVAAHGLPGWVAYGVFLGEVLGPVLVILGLFSRVGGAIIAINMLFAIWLAGMGRILSLTGMGGYALELEAFFLFGGVAILLLGAGRFSVGRGSFN